MAHPCPCSSSGLVHRPPPGGARWLARSRLAQTTGWKSRDAQHSSSTQCMAMLPDLHHLVASVHLPAIHNLLTLAYERVVYPCSTMNCGDVVHRSTLDPVLRMEEKGINPQGLALVLAALAYLTARPGVLEGAFDYYVLAKLQRLRDTRAYTKEDLVLGKKLASGGFGTVYKAGLIDHNLPNSEARDVILKKAKEFGEAEVWMNERLMRAAPDCYAEFITAFDEAAGGFSRGPEPLWLVWQYEGDFTLWDLMQKKDFPYNMEPMLFGRELDLPKGPRRRLITIRLVMQQILEALKATHRTGIVHRDIKPQNVIVSSVDRKVKLIDLGAAADLRIGINYVPNEFLLDPRYAPPQQYIMSTSTPRAPPIPVAATLSPILWRLNNPDRFDMYSAGMALLQMSFPNLRSDNNLIAFNRRLETFQWDLTAWRKAQERRSSRDFQEGFAMLDLDGGAPWSLLTQLVTYAPNKRLSADAALRHPAFGGKLGAAFSGSVRKASEVLDNITAGDWATSSFSKGGTGRSESGLTEAQLSDELGARGELPPTLRNASATVAWWQDRQAAFNRAVAMREARQRRNRRQARKGGRSQMVQAAEEDEEDELPAPPARRRNGNRVGGLILPKFWSLGQGQGSTSG